MNEDPNMPKVSPLQIKDLHKFTDNAPVMSEADIDAILKKTGAKACIIILSNSPIPCENMRLGKECNEPHDLSISGKYIGTDQVPTIFDTLAQMSKIYPPKIY